MNGKILIHALAILLTAVTGSRAAVAETPDQLPLSEVKAVVKKQLASQEAYEPGDLLCRSQVVPIFDELSQFGGRKAELDEILNAVPPDDAFLVRQLHTRGGRTFMRQVAKYPGAYDRLDHLAAIPRGEALVAQLIRDKGGYKMIEYMTTDGRGGRNLGRELSRVPHGDDFNGATGRIYTEEQLLEALRELYEPRGT